MTHYADGEFTVTCWCGAVDTIETSWFPTAHSHFMGQGWKYTPDWFCPKHSGKVIPRTQGELAV